MSSQMSGLGYRVWLLVLALSLAGCALLPLSNGSLAGRYEYPLGFNYGGSLQLDEDGTYTWFTSLFYCSPLFIVNENGITSESLSGGLIRRLGIGQ